MATSKPPDTSNARIEGPQQAATKDGPTFGQFNLKISLHWSVQISTFEAYIPPPYIVIGLVIPIILTVIWKNQWEGIFIIL